MASKRLQAEVQRRDTAASLLQLAMRELGILMDLLREGRPYAHALPQAAKVQDMLLLVEERTGVKVPRSLFGESCP